MPKERLWMGRSASHSLDWLSSGCQCRKFASNGVQDKVKLVSNDDCNSERKHGANVMAVKLNRRAFEFAKELVRDDKVVIDDRDAWSEHQPSTQQENEFIRQHGFGEYAKWHLGTDDSQPEGGNLLCLLEWSTAVTGEEFVALHGEGTCDVKPVRASKHDAVLPT